MATAHVMRSPSGGVRNIEEEEEAKGIVWKGKEGRKEGRMEGSIEGEREKRGEMKGG